MSETDIAVIGGGIAALTAAEHAALAGASVRIFTDTDLYGGLVANVGELDGYPAPGRLSGLELASSLLERGQEVGVSVEMAAVDAIAAAGDGFELTAETGRFRARQVIAATGAHLKRLDVPGAERLSGKGVSQCAWCDGGLYKGASVVVVGGGDAALSEAIHLAKFARSIKVVTRGDRFRARQGYVNHVASDERFDLRWSSEVVEVLGADGVEGVRVRSSESGETEDFACDGVFVFVGLVANAKCLSGLADLDAKGFVVTDALLETRTKGLWAIGALRSGAAGRLVTAAGEGAAAADRAVRRLEV